MAVLLRSGVGEGSEAARVILQLVEADEPPAHLPVGPDAIRNIREKIGAIQAEIAAWEAVRLPPIINDDLSKDLRGGLQAWRTRSK